MPIDQLINRPCTLLLRDSSGTTDDYGNDLPTENTAVDTVCELQRKTRANEEPDDQGETSDTLWALFLPVGTVLDTGDAVIVDEFIYELVGDPWNVRNPRTQTESHIECTVRRVAAAEDAS